MCNNISQSTILYDEISLNLLIHYLILHKNMLKLRTNVLIVRMSMNF